MKKIIVGILVIVLVGGGVFWLLNRNDNKQSNTSDDQSTTGKALESAETINSSDALDDEGSVLTIVYTNDRFNPDSYTIKSGDKITIKNDSTSELDFASADHPTHTKDAELNVGLVGAKSSVSLVLTTKGTWGFHNHNNSTHTGTIIVE